MLAKFEDINDMLVVLRDRPVLLDRDVAALYGVETREVNQAVKNNPDKFPTGYIFQVDKNEFEGLKSKLLISKESTSNRGGARKLPFAFTEKGLYMLATILKSKVATQATIGIIETFAKVRSLKHDIVALHTETDKEKQKSMMQRFSDALTDIVMSDLQVSETESTLELNFIVGKLKHTVKRTKRADEEE